MFTLTERQILRKQEALKMIKKVVGEIKKGTSEVKFEEPITPARATGNLWNMWVWLSSKEGADSVMFKIPPEIK